MAQKRWVFYVNLVFICGCGEGVTTFRGASPPSNSEVEQNFEESESIEEPLGEEMRGEPLVVENPPAADTSSSLSEPVRYAPRAPSRVVITPRTVLVDPTSEMTALGVPPPQVHRGNAPYDRLPLTVVPQEEVSASTSSQQQVSGEETDSPSPVEVFDSEKVVTPPEAKKPSVAIEEPSVAADEGGLSSEKEQVELDTEGLGVVARVDPSPTTTNTPPSSAPVASSVSPYEGGFSQAGEEEENSGAGTRPMSTQQLLQDYYAMQRAKAGGVYKSGGVYKNGGVCKIRRGWV